MKLNKRLRRINRGIALAVALLLALTGYIIYDTVNFGPQKQEIQTLLTDYLTALPELNQLPEEYREFGKAVPEEVLQEKIQENNESLQELFTYSSRGYNSLEYMQESFEHAIREQGKGEGFFLDGKVIIREIAVQKTGPSTADVDATYTIIFDMSGDCYFHNGSYGWDTADLRGHYTDESQSDETKLDTTARRYTEEIT